MINKQNNSNSKPIYVVISGEKVKLIKHIGYLSFIFLGQPHIEYFKSKHIKLNINDSNYSSIKIFLN